MNVCARRIGRSSLVPRCKSGLWTSEDSTFNTAFDAAGDATLHHERVESDGHNDLRGGSERLEADIDGRRLSLLVAFSFNHGGLLEAGPLSDAMRQDYGQPISVLSRWIVERKMLFVRAGGGYHIPLFQFLPAPLRPDPAIATMLNEMHGVLDDWYAAFWFVAPNAALGGYTPAQCFRADLDRVLDATRQEIRAACG